MSEIVDLFDKLMVQVLEAQKATAANAALIRQNAAEVERARERYHEINNALTRIESRQMQSEERDNITAAQPGSGLKIRRRSPA